MSKKMRMYRLIYIVDGKEIMRTAFWDSIKGALERLKKRIGKSKFKMSCVKTVRRTVDGRNTEEGRAFLDAERLNLKAKRRWKKLKLNKAEHQKHLEVRKQFWRDNNEKLGAKQRADRKNNPEKYKRYWENHKKARTPEQYQKELEYKKQYYRNQPEEIKKLNYQRKRKLEKERHANETPEERVARLKRSAATEMRYYWKNREKVIGWHKAWAEKYYSIPENRKAKSEKEKLYRNENLEKFRARSREYANRPENRAKAKETPTYIRNIMGLRAKDNVPPAMIEAKLNLLRVRRLFHDGNKAKPILTDTASVEHSREAITP